jgi:hypothetical protein
MNTIYSQLHVIKNSWVGDLRLSKIIDVLGSHVDVIKNNWLAGFKGSKI